MKLITKLAALAGLAIASIAPASAQMDWDGAWIAGGEIYMTDELGNGYWADPYADQAFVDDQGNVYNDYTGTMEATGLYLDELTPDTSMGSDYYGTYENPVGSDETYMSSSTYVPYENPVDSHQSFINSIWE